MKTKPFDLDAAKQGAMLVTRGGKPVRIVCFDKNSKIFPIVALVKDNYGNEFPCIYTNKGNYYSDNRTTPYDLFILEGLQYMPYESAEEFMQAQREHGWYIKMNDYYKPYTDKNDDVWYVTPVEVTDRTLFFANIGADTDVHDIKYNELVNYQWADGTPCGKIKEE